MFTNMDKTKKRGDKTKQRVSSSKGNKKVEVHKHFDPSKSKSYVTDDFPEILLMEKTSGRSTSSTPSKVKRNQRSINYYDIEYVPDKRSISCDRKEYKSSSSSSSTYSFAKKLFTNIEDKGKRRNTNKSPQRPPRETSKVKVNQKSTNKNQIQEESKSNVNNVNKNKTPSPSLSPIQSIQDAFVLFKDPVVEKIKEEIGMSAKFCNEEVKQTVAELREEIAKYRKTLNRNVNFLQNKVKGSFSGDKVKENGVQTEPAALHKDKEFNDLVSKIAELINLGKEN